MIYKMNINNLKNDEMEYLVKTLNEILYIYKIKNNYVYIANVVK